jgi:hypothetical protein
MNRGRARLLFIVVVALIAAWLLARLDKGHAWLGISLVALLTSLAAWGLVLRLLGRMETPISYLTIQYWTENLLILQAIGGIVLLTMGRRSAAGLFPWDHYLYGSLFPLVALVAGRVAGYRREREYVGMAWGAFFAAALSLQAVATGCEFILNIGCLTG